MLKKAISMLLHQEGVLRRIIAYVASITTLITLIKFLFVDHEMSAYLYTVWGFYFLISTINGALGGWRDDN